MELLSYLEKLILLMLVVMIITGVSSFLSRRNIKMKLKLMDIEFYQNHFGGEGSFNESVSTSKYAAKFFLNRGMWAEITDQDLRAMLEKNRKVELIYYIAFVLTLLSILCGIIVANIR